MCTTRRRRSRESTRVSFRSRRGGPEDAFEKDRKSRPSNARVITYFPCKEMSREHGAAAVVHSACGFTPGQCEDLDFFSCTVFKTLVVWSYVRDFFFLVFLDFFFFNHLFVAWFYEREYFFFPKVKITIVSSRRKCMWHERLTFRVSVQLVQKYSILDRIREKQFKLIRIVRF